MTTLAANPSRARLWAEFLILFVGVPIVMAATFGQYRLLTVVWLLAAISAALLFMTPGFDWRMLRRGPVLREWRIILVFTLITAATCVAFVFALVPHRFLEILLNRPDIWLMIMVAYPLLSAWPQELIYRSLFIERYGVLFPGPTALIIANGAAFGFGHLFYMEPVTILMTAAGGAIMGWAYLRNRSMLLAWVMHALAGNLIFTTGLGTFFYSGAIGG